MLRLLAFVLGLLFLAGVILDAFQTIILPRRPKKRFRITRAFFLLTWRPFRRIGAAIKDRRARDQFFSVFGPFSLLLLLVLWATLLVTGFALVLFALGTPFHDALNPYPNVLRNFRLDLYASGTSLFTLGPGDVTPQTHLARALLVLESGTGLGFVALVIGYLPVLYQTFSRREVNVALLDGRAGSPPTAAELLVRHGYEGGHTALISLLIDWERWSAELLESHVSYPILCYYRSQHDNQNWLSALICVLDTCALLITAVKGDAVRQAQLTFAMARHALVDLSHIFSSDAGESSSRADRLSPEAFHKLCRALDKTSIDLCGDDNVRSRLTELRAMYEPHAFSLCEYLQLSLPQWTTDSPATSGDWKAVQGLSREQNTGIGEHVSELATANIQDAEHG